MRVVTRSASRLPRIPLGIIAFVVLWGAVVAASRLLTHVTGITPDLCLFHRLTGYSCPTCGTTRGLLALSRGALLESFAWNPLIMTVAAVGALVFVGRLLTAKTLMLELTQGEKRVLLVLGLALLGTNWAWLIYSHP